METVLKIAYDNMYKKMTRMKVEREKEESM